MLGWSKKEDKDKEKIVSESLLNDLVNKSSNYVYRKELEVGNALLCRERILEIKKENIDYVNVIDNSFFLKKWFSDTIVDRNGVSHTGNIGAVTVWVKLFFFDLSQSESYVPSVALKKKQLSLIKVVLDKINGYAVFIDHNAVSNVLKKNVMVSVECVCFSIEMQTGEEKKLLPIWVNETECSRILSTHYEEFHNVLNGNSQSLIHKSWVVKGGNNCF